MNSFHPHPRLWPAWGVAFIFALLVPASARAVPLVGLTDSNRLVLFDSASPVNVVADVGVTGLRPGEALLGIDIRPATGRLYAVGSTSRLYVVNTATGAATPVGDGPFAPALNVSAAGGFEVGVSFDATQGWLRVVSNGQSLRLDPDSGTVVSLDGPLFNTPFGLDSGRVPAVTGLAHEAGFTSSTLYGIDWKNNRLVTIGSRGGRPASPNTGEVFGVGPLFVDAGPPEQQLPLTPKVGFDILSAGLGYVSLAGSGAPSSSLHLVDLTTGEAHAVGPVGAGGLFLRGLAALPAGSSLYALTAGNRLLLINAYMPGGVLSSTPVTGLQPGESLLALEVRLKDGHLYAAGGGGRLYRIAPSSGAATQVGPDPISPPLAGTEFSLARDTFRDQMRLVGDAGRSWRFGFGFGGAPFSLDTGTLAYATGDANAGRNPRVVGLAASYIPDRLSFGVRYYGIDADGDALVYEQEPDLGTLHTVGPLGHDAGDSVGFDIGFDAVLQTYASLTPPCPGGCPSPSTLFTLDLKTGRAEPVGGIGGGEVVRDIVTAPVRSLGFVKSAYRVEEDCTGVDLVVVRAGSNLNHPNEAAAEFETGADGPLPGPPADARSDYNAAPGTLSFAPGKAFTRIRVLINEDSYPEKTGGHEGEAFAVTLRTPRAPNDGGVALESPGRATVLIVDDDDEGIAQGNPIDASSDFVCQQYHDFLNRDPDAEGLAFWYDNIERCGGDAGCREAKRVDTAAAFFLSIEFQETGFFVYRAYQATFGRAPAPLTFDEFARDVRRVGEGVVIGRPGALERLEANKVAFIEEFIGRPQFLGRYPLIRPDEAENFVGSLDANSGGVLSPAERAALVAQYAGGGGRRLILRRVVEDEDFRRLASGRAFVLAQYFGYLRRDPAEVPDSDFSGFDFWLRKLAEHGGDFRAAEMVRAFITSGEYRRRFGPD